VSVRAAGELAIARPFLTAIVPTIGRSTLGRAAASVERQSVETIVHVSRDPQQTGIVPTLNRALPHIGTEWLCTLGDDDVLHPKYAEYLMPEISGSDLVMFRMKFEPGQILPITDRIEALGFGTFGASYAMRTDLAREFGGWCASPLARPGKSGEDWTMFEAARAAQARIKVLPTVAYYVGHDPFARLCRK
jgi:hypothetical protein